MEFEQLASLIDRVSASGLQSFRYEEGDVRISMQCQKMEQREGGQNSQAGLAQPQERQPKPQGNVVTSPLVGTFYAAPSEDAPPFITVGDRVEKGQVVAIVEAMKLMNEIECEFDGEVAKIYVENGQAVEYGQPLFEILQKGTEEKK